MFFFVAEKMMIAVSRLANSAKNFAIPTRFARLTFQKDKSNSSHFSFSSRPHTWKEVFSSR